MISPTQRPKFTVQVCSNVGIETDKKLKKRLTEIREIHLSEGWVDIHDPRIPPYDEYQELDAAIRASQSPSPVPLPIQSTLEPSTVLENSDRSSTSVLPIQLTSKSSSVSEDQQWEYDFITHTSIPKQKISDDDGFAVEEWYFDPNSSSMRCRRS